MRKGSFELEQKTQPVNFHSLISLGCQQQQSVNPMQSKPHHAERVLVTYARLRPTKPPTV